MEKRSGIYKITDLRNNKIYIGRSVNLQYRKWKHFCYCHPEDYSEKTIKKELNMKIHRAMAESRNANDFQFEILEYCSEKELDEKEQYYIKKYNTKYPNGYNDTEGGKTYPHLKGEEHFCAKITQKEVDQIYELLLQKKSVQEIQNIIPIATIGMISAINNGYNWRKEGYEYPLSRLNGVIKVTDNNVLDIRKMYKEGKTISEINKIFNDISRQAISDIIYGRTHKNILQPNEELPKIKKKHCFSEQEVNFFRQEFYINQKTGPEIYKEYKDTNEDPISYSSFMDMVKGRSYTQYKIYNELKPELKKPIKVIEKEKAEKNKAIRNERNKKIIELYKQNFTKKQISEIVGCSERTVYRIINNK